MIRDVKIVIFGQASNWNFAVYVYYSHRFCITVGHWQHPWGVKVEIWSCFAFLEFITRLHSCLIPELHNVVNHHTIAHVSKKLCHAMVYVFTGAHLHVQYIQYNCRALSVQGAWQFKPAHSASLCHRHWKAEAVVCCCRLPTARVSQFQAWDAACAVH